MPKLHYPYTIAVDWLQLYCEANEQPREGHYGPFEIQVKEYPTAQFLMKASIYYRIDGRKREFAMLLYKPRTNVMKETACQLRVINEQLYTQGWLNRLRNLLSEMKLEYKSISRIDLAADFNRFYAGLHPLTLIRGFLSQKYLKIGINRGYCAFKSMGYLISNQTKEINNKFSLGMPEYTGITWGSKGYIQTQLYNKSQEFKDKGNKPWIVEQWEAAGLDINNVWRLEFRIQKAGKQINLLETGDIFSFGLSELSTEDRFCELFKTYVDQYARFVKRDYHIKKQQMKPIQLFSNLFDAQTSIKRKIHVTQHPSMKTPQILVSWLDNISGNLQNQIYHVKDREYNYHISRVRNYVLELFPYAFSEKKEPNVNMFLKEASEATKWAGEMLQKRHMTSINRAGKLLEQEDRRNIKEQELQFTPLLTINRTNRNPKAGLGPESST